MGIKAFTRQLIPPIIWHFLQRLAAQKYRTYSSWASAAAAASSYDDAQVNKFRVARAANASPPSLVDNALNWLIRLYPGPLSVVDFGGSVGELGAALLAVNPGVLYTVVENPTLVGLMSAKGLANFQTALPESCDIFYSSGTLQYIADPYRVLEDGFRSAKTAVVLKRNNFSEREIFRVHISRLFDNGMGPIPDGFENIYISYPYQTVRESEIVTIANRNGFKLFARTPEYGDAVTIEQEGVYGAQLVFLKETQIF